MDRNKAKQVRRDRRRVQIRRRVTGTPTKPRLSVYRSLKHIYAQLIDDVSGTTVASASTRDKGVSAGSPGSSSAAAEVGKMLAERARAKGVETACFDRGGFRFHGRIKALADAAREGGLKF